MYISIDDSESYRDKMTKDDEHHLKIGLAAPFIMAVLVIFGMVILMLA